MNDETRTYARTAHSGPSFLVRTGRIEDVREGAGYARLRLALDPPTPAPAPGQFFMVRFPWGPALPRAFSVLGATGEQIELFVKTEGLLRGEMTKSPRGGVLEVRGPYGVPYAERIDRTRQYVLVGGGSGVAPLLHFAERFPDRVAALALGFRSAGVRPLLPGFDLVAEDESGETAEDRMCEQWRDGLGIIACGPEPLLAGVVRRFLTEPATYVSLEVRLGCGFGSCRGCTIPTSAGSRRVCVDGPLFACSEVPWLA